MSNPAQSETIDLAASAARVRSARVLAAAQARQVAAVVGGADKPSIDLLFLLQENVLVMTETHLMLKALAGRDALQERWPEDEPRVARLPLGARRGRHPRRAISTAVVLGLAIMASAWLLEILDPAPMDVEASIAHFFRLHGK